MEIGFFIGMPLLNEQKFAVAITPCRIFPSGFYLHPLVTEFRSPFVKKKKTAAGLTSDIVSFIEPL
jgi:hypothetical protein